MKLKKGVNPLRLQPEMVLALMVAENVWFDNGQELVVTSLNDSEHSRQSLHYSGNAADLRIRYFAPNQHGSIEQQLRDALGNNPDYDIVLEATHIHIEYQPKRRSL